MGTPPRDAQAAQAAAALALALQGPPGMHLKRQGSAAAAQGSAAARASRQLTQGGGLPFALRHSGLLASGIRPVAASRRAFSAQAAAAAPAAVKHEVVREAHGFKLEREQFVKEYDSTVLLYRHQRTGGPRCSRQPPRTLCCCCDAPGAGSSWGLLDAAAAAAAAAGHLAGSSTRLQQQQQQQQLTRRPPRRPARRRRAHLGAQQRREQDVWRGAAHARGQLLRYPPHPGALGARQRCAALRPAQRAPAPALGAPGSSGPAPGGCRRRRRRRRACSAPRLCPLLQVLCGSRKYPIKEPFVELMKGSLNTFLNAFTYPGAPLPPPPPLPPPVPPDNVLLPPPPLPGRGLLATGSRGTPAWANGRWH
jgi:hypothetical protein